METDVRLTRGMLFGNFANKGDGIPPHIAYCLLRMRIVNRFHLGTGSESFFNKNPLRFRYRFFLCCAATVNRRTLLTNLRWRHTHKLLQSRGELSCYMRCTVEKCGPGKNDPKSGCISQRRKTPRVLSPVIPVRGICAPKAVIQLICTSIWPPHNTALYSGKIKQLANVMW